MKLYFAWVIINIIIGIYILLVIRKEIAPGSNRLGITILGAMLLVNACIIISIYDPAS